MSETSFLDATRETYDAVAADYAEQFSAELTGRPVDRALFSAFAEFVLTGPGGPVADLGCGPGHGTAHLARLGLDAFGVDLSSAMVAVARKTHPSLRFDVGSMTALEIPSASLGGIVAMYSIINIPPDQLPGLFAEFYRVLAPGGHLLLAFQTGDEKRHMTEWLGHAVSLDFYRLPADRVADLLGDTGLAVDIQLRREPDNIWEKVQRAYLLAHKV